MLETTHKKAPWVVLDSVCKREAGLNAIRTILTSCDYDGKDESLLAHFDHPEAVSTIRKSL